MTRFVGRLPYASALETGAVIDAARAWGQLGDCLEERSLIGRIAATLRRPAGW